jgi:type IV pilus secretin PilQ/predicted competence protein
MNKQWKLALTATTVCLLTIGVMWADTAQPAWQNSPPTHLTQSDLLDLRIDSQHGATSVTLWTDGRVEYEAFVLDGPDRLVVDLPGVINRLERYSYNVDQDGLARVRAAQHQTAPIPVTRVVFDLHAPLAYEISESEGGLEIRFGEAAQSDWQPAEPAEPVFHAAPPEAEPVETEPVLDEPAEPVFADPEEVVVAEPVEPLVVAAEEPAMISDLTAPVVEQPEAEAAAPSRSVDANLLDRLAKQAPALEAPAPQAKVPTSFQTKTIQTDVTTYSGKRISLNLVDVDVKQVFRLFHEISGLNFVLDPQVSGNVTIVLDRVPWDQALDLILKNNGLDKEFENNVLRIASTQKLASEAAARKQLKEASDLEVEPITLTRTLSYAKAGSVDSVIRDSGVLSQRGKVIVDERTNTLIISDIPKKIEPLDALISTLDAETPQVMIEARIVETTRTFAQDLGVTWGFQAIADASRGTQTNVGNASARYGLNLPGQQASTLGFSFSNIIDSFTLDIALNALESEGEGRILSSPRIVTQNNERAEIEQGVRIPIVNTTATEINVEFVSASLKLTVTPQITAEGTVVLDVLVENNSPDFVNTAADIPSIRTQRAQTKVLVRDGGTTVIGGIFAVTDGRSEIGVPWFRKIPVFGWMFRSQNITKENRELLIFITPKIVKLN